MLEVVRGLANVTGQLLSDCVRAIFELNKTIAEFIQTTMASSLELAYRLVDAALAKA